MRLNHFWGALLAVGLVVSTASCTNASAATKVCTLKVDGLTCATCEPPVKKAAEALPGVAEAEVSFAEGAARVTYDPTKTTPEAIAKVINEQTRFRAAVSSSEP